MAIELNNRSLITLYGGSGFLGRHIVRALAKTGARMRVAVRRPELAGHLQPLGGVGQINAVQAALQKINTLVLDKHLHTCVTTAIRGDDPNERERVIDEIIQVFTARGKS